MVRSHGPVFRAEDSIRVEGLGVGAEGSGVIAHGLPGFRRP